MKKPYFLFLLLPCLLLTACVKESPEPLYHPETQAPETREALGTKEHNGIIYQMYNDNTCEIIEADSDVLSQGTLSLLNSYDDHPVVAIADEVFQDASATQVLLPEKLQRIGDRAFERCPLLWLKFPDSLTEIGEEAFSGCSRVETITFGKGLTEIPTGAFFGCRSLKELTLPEGIRSIGEEAFGDTVGLEQILLPSTLTHIGPFAFWHCGTESLSFSIPPSVETIGVSAFDQTAWLNGWTEGFLVVGDGILLRYVGTDKAVTVPDGVKYLSNAFDSSSVVTLTLPDSVEGAAKDALANTCVAQIHYNGQSQEILSLLAR